jgi:hypothetical protein
MSVRRWVATLRGRANQIQWQADGDVVLRYTLRSEAVEIVPDATVVSQSRPIRVFMEVDRSNQSLGRIRENLVRYEAYVPHLYAQVFTDHRNPFLLYVVRSTARREGIERIAEKALSGCRWRVLLADEAPGWLAKQLLEPDSPARVADPVTAPRPAIRERAHEVLSWTNDLLGALEDEGSLDGLRRRHPDLFDRGKDCLIGLRDEVQHG